VASWLTLYDASYLEQAQRRAVPLAALGVEMCDAARSLGLDVIGT
jgi:predicted nucleic acid-binding protein